MFKTVRNKLLVLSMSVFAFAVGAFCFASEDALTAALAEASPVTEAGNFEVKEGASIRIVENAASGIRWKVSVSQAYHDYVSSLGTVKYHTLIDNVPVVEKDAASTQVDILCTATPAFNENGVWEYTASIVYDQLKSDFEEAGKTETEVNDLLLQAYGVELYAKAYVEITPASGEKTLKYAQTTGTARSIKGIAMHCVLSEEYTAEDAAFNSISTYAGEELEVVTTETAYNVGITNMYSESDGAGSVTSETALAAGDYDVYVGARRIETVTLSSDGAATVTLPELFALSDMAGKDVDLRFVDANDKVTVVPFRYATKVIDDENDVAYFKVATDSTTFGGYYLLKENITRSSLAQIQHRAAGDVPTKTAGLTGTFDGNGYALSSFITQGGLFGFINGGTVKNLALKNWTCQAVTGWGAVPLAMGIKNATIDNCYFETASLAVTAENRQAGFANYIDSKTKISNTVIYLNYYFGSYAADNAPYGLVTRPNSPGTESVYPPYNKVNNANWNMEGVIVRIPKGTKLMNASDGSVYAQNQQAAYDADETSANKKIINGVCYYEKTDTYTYNSKYANYSTAEDKDGFTQGYNKNVWTFTEGSNGFYIKIPEWKSAPVKS